MPNALTQICEEKRVYVESCKSRIPVSSLQEMVKNGPETRGFRKALSHSSRDSYGLIAEIKKASPSAGLIRKGFDPKGLAKEYQLGGATCLSVLTDTPFFQGEDEHLIIARSATDIPVLRKDFIIDPYQVIEARAIGADCILLIMAQLDIGLASELEALALELGMDVLIEVHSAEELNQAMKLKSRLIGINNRNLKTLKTDIRTTVQLAPMVPSDYLLVCESGLKTASDLALMAKSGPRCFLIGEALMSQSDVQTAVKKILANPYKNGQ
jgi:indole-3-glycerol phosphate synthase